MATYRFGDRLIESAIPLYELPIAAACARSIALLFASDRPETHARAVDPWLHHWPDDYGAISFSLARAGNAYLLRFPGFADFILDVHANRIRVEPVAGIDPGTLEHLLIDQVLPRFLAQQGELLVHACAVIIEGRLVLFIADSGWGKSTLAAHLHDAGQILLSDDCVLLHVAGASVFTVPTYPSLRLFSDSLERLYPDAAGLAAVAQYSDKRRVLLPAVTTPGNGFSADALYFLNSPENSVDACAIDRLRPLTCCLETMKHAFKLDVTDRAQSARILGQCAAVANALPAFSLAYPRQLDDMPVLLEFLQTHVRTLPITPLSTASSVQAKPRHAYTSQRVLGRGPG